MAIASIGAGISSGFNGSASSFAINVTNSVGDVVLISIVFDNIGTTDGDLSEVTSVTDTRGNTYTKLKEITNGEGAAGAGVTTSLWYSRTTVALSSNLVTANLSGTSAGDAVMRSWKFSVGADLVVAGSDSNVTDAANGFGSSTISGLASASRLYFRALGKEANATTNITVSSGFTQITTTRSRNNAAAVLSAGEFRINTSTGETSNPTLAVSGDTAAVFVALEESAGSQSITGSLVTDADTFYAATIALTDQYITGSLFSDPDTFRTSVLSATYSIAGTLYADADTFYSSTVSATYTITGALFSDGDTFSTAVIGRGAVDIGGVLYDDPDTFYTAAVATGGATQGITGSLFSDGDTFFTATVAATYAITGSLVADGDTFYTGTVSTIYAVTGALFSDGDTFFSGAVSAAYDITGSLVVDGDTFYTAALSGANNTRDQGGGFQGIWRDQSELRRRREKQRLKEEVDERERLTALYRRLHDAQEEIAEIEATPRPLSTARKAKRVIAALENRAGAVRSEVSSILEQIAALEALINQIADEADEEAAVILLLTAA